MKGEKKNLNWTVKWFKKPKLKNPILIEGLPGIANVGKIAVDFIVEQKKAVKICEFSSYDLPHLVFVREDNLITLPKLELYHCKDGHKEDLLFLIGDVQPNSERACYEFCHALLSVLKDLGTVSIITTGGIGLSKVPKSPKVYCTANDKKIMKEFSKMKQVYPKTYGVVGPIVGVTGLLLGIAGEYGIPSIALLSETFAHPMYFGMKSARAILNVLNEKFTLKLNMKNLDSEIADIEKEILMRTKQLSELDKAKKEKSLNYIG